jgi:hypothetical protein
MLTTIHRFIIPAALDVLPLSMTSDHARAMLLAIALQESKCSHRKQVRGPARGFWQFETIGVTEVKRHPASKGQLELALMQLCCRPSTSASELQAMLEHNDILAATVARLALWRHPGQLPARDDPAEGWRQYIEIWKPGRPHAETWPANYDRAWELVAGDS